MSSVRICASTDDSISLITQRQSKSHDYREGVSEHMCVKSYVKSQEGFQLGQPCNFGVTSSQCQCGGPLSAACAPKRRSYKAQTQLGDRNSLITTPRRPC